ncbi:hypothetical protein [Geoglobus acetivorans]|uniref:Uncharacterized protein n=1 Tax=Geoglobus acetivorans TaxID=565033 RepID=A0ABZ3H4Y8_GEOAI|nr:hypothetical protein [Geoglobus acetivorans]
MIEVIRVTELQNKRKSIEVICPKCGNPGRLRMSRANIFGDIKFRVIHGREYRQRVCSFGLNSEEYDGLYEVFMSVKGEEI